MDLVFKILKNGKFRFWATVAAHAALAFEVAFHAGTVNTIATAVLSGLTHLGFHGTDAFPDPTVDAP